MAKRKQGSAKSAGAEAAAKEYRKPQADVYTLLLVVAFLMICVAIGALWMTMKEYDNAIKGGPTPVWNLPAHGVTLDPQNGVA